MSNNVPDGVCRFYLFVVAVVCAALAASIYSSTGPSVGVAVLACLCIVSLWAAVFASGRIRSFIASIFTSGV